MGDEFHRSKGTTPYSIGVLHTSDVEKAFSSLPPMVSSGGKLCGDFCWKRFQTMLHAKYLFRPISKPSPLPQQELFTFLQRVVPVLLPVSQALGGIPVLGKVLKRFLPIADYTGVYPLSAQQIKEWALLDIFDMLASEYDNPQTMASVKKWFNNFGFIEIFHAGHLVGRGRKPL